MKRFLLIMSLLSWFGSATAQDFAEGQIWRYKTRKGEESSRVLINKIEAIPKLGKVFHISLSAVKVKNPQIAGGISTELPHFPVSEATLKQSVITFTGKSKVNPEYREGYEIWKSAVEKGEAGVFTIGIAEIVDVVKQGINRQ
jgi:hypothetical protein